MPLVTVSGGGGTIVTIPITSAANAVIAQTLLDGVSAGVDNGSITPYRYAGLGSFTPPGGESMMILTGPGAVTIPATTGTLVDIATVPVVLFGGTAAEQLVVAGTGGITYFTNTGSGTVIAGGGNNTIIVPAGSNLTSPVPAVGDAIGTAASPIGEHLILTDLDNDNITALSGNVTISAGLGDNSIVLGTGNALVDVTGHDLIQAGSGSATINATAGEASVQGSSGAITFIGGDVASVVLGGMGSVTVTAGAGGGVFHGGTDGNNLLLGGIGATSLFGAGNGDMLIGFGNVQNLLVAGAGSETLLGAGTGDSTFRAGSGHTSMTGGSGADTLYAGSGRATMTGSFGADSFTFVHGDAGGRDLVTDFMKGTDSLVLSGYASDEFANALNSASQNNAGTTITLSDNTTITFAGLTISDLRTIGAIADPGSSGH